MKKTIVGALAAFALTGCVAVPGPYGEAYYYPAAPVAAPVVVAPAVGFGFYAGPGYRHRHYRNWH